MQPEPQPERRTARRELPLRAPVAIAASRQADPRIRPEPQDPPCHDARALTEGGSEAEIRLDGVRYVLRITRQGKLILTK